MIISIIMGMVYPYMNCFDIKDKSWLSLLTTEKQLSQMHKRWYDMMENYMDSHGSNISFIW